ncbi:serine hydrolase [Streptomyces sp. B6B3]|uniref:serine hydrolase n=1 Tax=Streptomyces sp. B6B3 TaxID=3153570 RepID=UPI00325E686E
MTATVPNTGDAMPRPHRPLPLLLALLAALTLLPLAGPATATAAAAPPDTPVGRQLTWLLDASHRLPLTEREIGAHLTPALLDAVGGAPGFNDLLADAAGDDGLRLDSYRSQQAPRDGVEAYALATGGPGRSHLVLVTDASGALAALTLTPLPESWAELDERLRAVAPDVSFLAARVDPAGECHPVHALAPDTARPIGSAFKLYVLGALAEAVRAGSASWDEPLAVRDEWKAPGGPVADLPAGTRLTLREYADHMIFHSDNSATDHLMHRLGRDAVEAQQTRFGMADPAANEPFLGTRELTQLKAVDYPRHADAYVALDEADRRAYLAEVLAGLPVPDAGWDEPRHVDSVEWFASPADLCRALGGLSDQAAAPGGQPVDDALSLMGTRILGLDAEAWPVGWFKGGSEPGVMSRTFLAGAATGETYVVSAMASDPARDVTDAAGVAELLALSAGAFALVR